MGLITSRSSVLEALDPTPVSVVSDAPAPVVHSRGLKTAPRPTHANCSECCARQLCHWCVRPARGQEALGGGYVMLRWTDGFWYGACEDHARYLRASIDGVVSPDAVMAGTV